MHAEMLCEGCGSAGREVRVEPGSSKVELLLWLLFLLPGYLYRLWRRAGARSSCAACGSPMFPALGNSSPVKAITLGQDGRVFAAQKRDGVDVALSPFTALLTKAGVDVVGSEARLLSRNVTYHAWFPFGGSTFEVLDSERKAGKAALGAVAGALLAGPLGLVVGAALGGRKVHAIVATRDGSSIVFEASSQQLQTLAARGVLRG